MRDHDGLRAYAKKLLADGTLSQDQVLEIDRGVLAGIKEARAFAEASPYPDPSRLLDNVFA